MPIHIRKFIWYEIYNDLKERNTSENINEVTEDNLDKFVTQQKTKPIDIPKTK